MVQLVSQGRVFIWLAIHRRKKKNDGKEMETETEDPMIVEIQRMIGNNSSSVLKELDHDHMALVCGRDRRGRVRGLGSGISKTSFCASSPSQEIAQREKHNCESMRDKLKTLKISIVQQTNEHKILQEQLASLMETQRTTRGSSGGGSNSEETSALRMHLPSTCLVKNLR